MIKAACEESMPINGNLDKTLLTKINKNVKVSQESIQSSAYYLREELIRDATIFLWDISWWILKKFPSRWCLDTVEDMGGSWMLPWRAHSWRRCLRHLYNMYSKTKLKSSGSSLRHYLKLGQGCVLKCVNAKR